MYASRLSRAFKIFQDICMTPAFATGKLISGFQPPRSVKENDVDVRRNTTDRVSVCEEQRREDRPCAIAVLS